MWLSSRGVTSVHPEDGVLFDEERGMCPFFTCKLPCSMLTCTHRLARSQTSLGYQPAESVRQQASAYQHAGRSHITYHTQRSPHRAPYADYAASQWRQCSAVFQYRHPKKRYSRICRVHCPADNGGESHYDVPTSIPDRCKRMYHSDRSQSLIMVFT